MGMVVTVTGFGVTNWQFWLLVSAWAILSEIRVFIK